MNGDNMMLGVDELPEFQRSLVEFQTSGKLPIVWEEFIDYYPIS